MYTVRIWDLPTRMFHWGLALCVLGLLVTGHWGGQAMVWHFRLGYAALCLLLFRLVWGLVGGHWSRWSRLPVQPRHVWAYLSTRQASQTHVGHNPLGAWSIVAMVSFLLFQVATGLVSDDEISNAGPLTALVSNSWVSWATSWHTHWGKLIVLALVLTHLLALLWYRIKKHPPLLPAMVHGNKVLPKPVTASLDGRVQRGLALLLLCLLALLVAGLVSLGV